MPSGSSGQMMGNDDLMLSIGVNIDDMAQDLKRGIELIEEFIDSTMQASKKSVDAFKSIGVEMVVLNQAIELGIKGVERLGSAAWSGIKSGIDGIGDSIDRVSKQFRTSGNYDITIGSFQKLSFAAQQTLTPLSQVQQAFRKLDSDIGQATLGGKGAAQFNTMFKQMGLDAKAMSQLGMDDQIKAVAKSFEGIHNNSQRAALSMRAFGRSGIEIMQFLREMSEQSARFEKIAIPLSELDGAKIYNAKQALGEISTIFESIYNTIAAKVAPVITNVVHKFEDFGFTGANLKKYFDIGFSAVENFAVKTIAYSMAIYDTTMFVWDSFATAVIDSVKAAVSPLGVFFNIFGVGWKEVHDATWKVANFIEDTFVSVENALGPIFVTIANAFGKAFNVVLDGVRLGLNTLIAGFNSLPGVNLPSIPSMQVGQVSPWENRKTSGLENLSGFSIGNPVEDLIKLLSGASKGLGITDKFGESLDAAMKKVKDAFDKLLIDNDAQRRVDERKTERDLKGPLIEGASTKPLGFGGRIDQYGGPIGAIINGLQRAQQQQLVSDPTAHKLLINIAHNTGKPARLGK